MADQRKQVAVNLWLLDLVLTTVSFFLAYRVRLLFQLQGHTVMPIEVYLPSLAIILPLWAIVLLLFRVYSDRDSQPRDQILRLAKAVILAWFIAAVTQLFIYRTASNRLILGLTLLINLFLLTSYRVLLLRRQRVPPSSDAERRPRPPRGPLALFVLGMVALPVYGPGVNRVFADDQISYFAELGGRTSLAAGLQHYDYAASRRYEKGDDALFRPLLFVWLAVSNRLFSYHHAWWNVATLGLHVLVAFFLFRFLATVWPSRLALAGATLFLVMKPSLELPVWNHLGGYLLACLFLMIGFRAFLHIMLSGETPVPSRVLATYALSFTAAALTYEALLPVCVLAGILIGFLNRRHQRRPGLRMTLAAAAPVIVFAALYTFHMLRVERISYVDRPDVPGIFGLNNVISIFPRSLDALAHWTAEAAVPSALTFTPMTFHRLAKHFSFLWKSPLHLCNVLLSIMTLQLLVNSVSRSRLNRYLPLILLQCGAVFLYVAVIGLGRPQSDLMEIAYYLYFFCLMLVALAYTVIDFDRMRAWMMPAAWLIITALITLHAVETRATTREIGRVNASASSYLSTVSHFVDEHKGEPGFTFAIQNPPPRLDPEIRLREGYPDDPAAVVHVWRLTEILFKPYYNSRQPKYVIDSNGLILAHDASGGNPL
jgi:hypothetical protein